MAAIGASRSLRRVPATVSFLNPQPALSLAHANRPLCPIRDPHGRHGTGSVGWKSDLRKNPVWGVRADGGHRRRARQGEGPSHRQDGRQVPPASQWTAETVAGIVTGIVPFCGNQHGDKIKGIPPLCQSGASRNCDAVTPPPFTCLNPSRPAYPLLRAPSLPRRYAESRVRYR